MGLFDDLLRKAVGSEANDPENQSRSLLEGLGSMLQEPQTGGIDGVAQMFQKQGLGAQAQSWISSGLNQPVTPEQVNEALGEERVESLSRRMGLSTSAGSKAIAAFLPTLIDKLTPEGRSPETSRLGGLLAGLDAGAARPRADFSNVQSGSSTAPVSSQQSYTVVAGDSLSKIAKRFYGDANQWRTIFDANADQIANPDLIHPGQTLKIPARPKTG
jgi:uncharacterized protein YidB (DUF937 family)